MAETCRDLCDDGRLVVFEEATHWVLLEERARANEEIVEFFA